MSENKEITIKKAILKDGMFPQVTYTERTLQSLDEVNRKCNKAAHDETIAAFSRLNSHLASLCEQYDSKKRLDISACSVQGFVIGGNDEHEGVTLIGSRVLSSGGVINITSPFTKWGDDNCPRELVTLIEDCKNEIYAYLFEGKQAPEVQTSIEFPEETE